MHRQRLYLEKIQKKRQKKKQKNLKNSYRQTLDWYADLGRKESET